MAAYRIARLSWIMQEDIMPRAYSTICGRLRNTVLWSWLLRSLLLKSNRKGRACPREQLACNIYGCRYTTTLTKVRTRPRGLVTDMISVESSAEEVEKLMKTLPVVPGGLSVSQEVTARNSSSWQI